MMQDIKAEFKEYDGSEYRFCVNEMNSLPLTNSAVKNNEDMSTHDDIETKCILRLDEQINFDDGVTPQPFLYLPVESEMQDFTSMSVPNCNEVVSPICESTSSMCVDNLDIQEITSVDRCIDSKAINVQSDVDVPHNLFLRQDSVNMQDEFNKHYPLSAEIYEKIDLSSRICTEKNLNSHTYVEMTEPPFVCQICHMTFAEKSDLFQHSHTHIYRCEICNKIFIEKSALDRHMLSHTEGQRRSLPGERFYSCELCNKTFEDKYRLERHKRTHTGERPFTCDLCKKSFSQKSNLNKHKRIHFR